MKTVKIEGKVRSETGRTATRRLRADKQVPCVIYGGPVDVNFQVPQIGLKSLIYTPEFQIAEIHLEEKTYRCVLKDFQLNPVTDSLDHVDFLELVENKKVTVSLPIRFTGQPVGVKDGGKLEIKMKALRVKTYPKNLIANIEVNTENLELNKSIRVEDIRLEGFEILNSPRIPLASVGLTRVLKTEEAPAAAPVAGAATPAAPGAAPAAAPAGTPAPAPGKAAPTAKGEKKK